MKSQMNRKTFLQATLATSLAGLVACSGEGEDPAGGDGDGDMGAGTGGTGTGGAGTGGAGTGGAGTGGTGTGGAGTGGAGTGGAGTGGASTGGAGTGGSDVGTGGSDVGTGGSDLGTGGSDLGTGGDQGAACSAVMAEWVDNHDSPGEHAFMMEVSVADVEAGVEKIYNVQGASQHPHTLTVTAQNFTDLAANGMIELMTSEDFNHTHAVILTCSM